MVGCYQRGRIKIFLRNLLGEHKPKFDCDTICCLLTEAYINHPEELAWVLSLHFQDWFRNRLTIKALSQRQTAIG